MDMITLAMAKSYTDSQQLASYECQETVLLPETMIEGLQYQASYGASLVQYESRELYKTIGDLELDRGAEIPVTVEYDGVVYNTSLKHLFDEAFQSSSYLIGNRGIVGMPYGDDTGEPFLWILDRSTVAVVVMGEKESATFKVYLKDETIRHIDPKFIPWDAMPGGGGIATIELETVLSAGFETQLNANDCVKMDEALACGKPVMVSCTLMDMEQNSYPHTFLCVKQLMADRFYCLPYDSMMGESKEIHKLTGEWVARM